MHSGRIALLIVCACAVPSRVTTLCGDETSDLLRDIRQQRSDLDDRIAQQPDDADLLSARGDALFFLGEFQAAAHDYDRMVQLNPALDASHWRRGIAWFYRGEYEKAARQFERYHSFDDVDRENGIWRYLCQFKADGAEKARAGLLKYEKDDREPFPDVYRLFAGEIPPEQVLKRIETAAIDKPQREKRLFYAHLYIGLWHTVHDRPRQARGHLEKSVDNTWAPSAGYGPRYMWHVGRLQLQLLAQPDTPIPNGVTQRPTKSDGPRETQTGDALTAENAEKRREKIPRQDSLRPSASSAVIRS